MTANKIYNYVSPLHIPKILQEELKQLDTPANRDWLCKNSGFAYKICYAVPNMILKNPPLFLNKKGEPIPEKTAKWEKEDGSTLWKENISEDRKHGWAVADKTKLNPQMSYYLGKQGGYKVYSSPHVLELERDEEGDIVNYFIEFDLENGEVPTKTTQSHIKFTINYTKAHHVESIPQKNHLGISVLTKCWSHIIFAEWISYLTVFIDCYAKPLLFFPFPPNTPPAVKDEVKAQLEQLPLLKGLTGEVSQQGGMTYKPEWITNSMDIKFNEHLQVELSMVASDAEMPVRFLVGDPKGALASAAEDGLSVQEYLESVFKLYEPSIRYWCEQVGILKQNEEITIKPQVELRMSEKDKKEIEMIEVQKAQAMTMFAKINEVRKGLKLPELTEAEGGNVILGVQSVQNPKLTVEGLNPSNQPEPNQEQPPNKEVKPNASQTSGGTTSSDQAKEE